MQPAENKDQDKAFVERRVSYIRVRESYILVAEAELLDKGKNLGPEQDMVLDRKASFLEVVKFLQPFHPKIPLGQAPHCQLRKIYDSFSPLSAPEEEKVTSTKEIFLFFFLSTKGVQLAFQDLNHYTLIDTPDNYTFLAEPYPPFFL